MLTHHSKPTCLITTADYRQFPLSMLLQHPLLSLTIKTYAKRLNTTKCHQYLACRLLLAQLLQQTHQIKRLPEIRLSDNGRPVFIDTTLPDFNISHSQQLITVATISHGRIGVDIELIREKSSFLKIAKHYFHKNEYHYLTSLIDPQQQLKAFWKSWTLKEAALKLSAKGVWQMRQISIDLQQNTLSSPFCHPIYHHSWQHNFLQLAVCSDQIIESHTIKTIDPITPLFR